MKIIRKASYEEIINHLESLGSFDRKDTEEVLKPYNYYYLVELTKDEFLNSVFLSSDSVRHFVPQDEDRKLRSVAENANRNLTSNDNLGEGKWNLIRIISETQNWIRSKSPLSPIVIRDLKNGELEIPNASKYIHDGCHRSLGYAIKIINKKTTYKKTKAYLATNTIEIINPKGLGFAMVADFWLWGAMVLFIPTYFGFVSLGWHWPFYIIGILFLIVSFMGALFELKDLLRNEAYSYWGVSLVFLIPAILLFISTQRQIITGVFVFISKIAIMIFAAIGFPMFFQGIPYLFWNKTEEKEAIVVQESEKRKTSFEIIGNVLVALFSLATAIVVLVKALLN